MANAERYVVTSANRQGAIVERVEAGELPDGIDALLIVRSTLERPAMHNAVLAIQSDAFIRTWPPTDENGGDKAHLVKR